MKTKSIGSHFASRFLHLLCLLFATASFSSVSISKQKVYFDDYEPSEYEVRFTNPLCTPKPYPKSMLSNAEQTLHAPPKDVYCTRGDEKRSGERPTSPQYKLMEWIQDEDVNKVFIMALSFSNRAVANALCSAIRDRNLKLQVILDTGALKEGGSSALKKLLSENCVHSSAASSYKKQTLSGDQKYYETQNVQLFIRGGNDGFGYFHNKMFVFFTEDTSFIRMTHGSANVSSGVALHHENWHFVTIHTKSYFAQSHLCLIEASLNHSRSTKDFTQFLSQCRSHISAPEESDIKTFFVPGEGKKATRFIRWATQRAEKIYIAAHRFSYKALVSRGGKHGILVDRLKKQEPVDMRLIVDDDTYWTYKLNRSGKLDCRLCTAHRGEYTQRVRPLQKMGLKVKYMQTNHHARLVHHNKFLIFRDKKGNTSVFTGAGNLTGAAFSKNYEQFYYITIPRVTKAYWDQYQLMWNNLSSHWKQLPKTIDEGE